MQTNPTERYVGKDLQWDFECVSSTDKSTQVFIPAKYWPAEKGVQTTSVRKRERGVMTNKMDFADFSHMRKEKFKSLQVLSQRFLRCYFTAWEIKCLTRTK